MATLMVKRPVTCQQVHLLSQNLLAQGLLSKRLQPMVHSLQLHRQLRVKLHQVLGPVTTLCRSSPLLLLVPRLVQEGDVAEGAAEAGGAKEGKGGEGAGRSSIHNDSCPSPFQFWESLFWPSALVLIFL